jgi:hypothetical protein
MYRNRWLKVASNEGIDLVLLGCLDDIGKDGPDKPYLYLATWPPTAKACDRGTGLWRAMEGKGETRPFNVERGLEKDYPDFTLNLGGILNHGRDIKFPVEQLQKWTSGKVFALHNSIPDFVPTKITRYNAPYGYGLDIFVAFEDESLHFRCPTRR